MRFFRQAIYALVFYPATFLYVAGCFVASIFGSKPVRAVVRGWTDFHHELARLLGTRLEVRGSIPTGSYLIAVKHQSMFETLEIVRLAKTPVIVLKRELSRLPGFGWATRRYGVIPVDRGAGAKALREMLAMGRKAASTGRSVVIYPEGTRVRPGHTPPLQAGFAGLYKALGPQPSASKRDCAFPDRRADPRWSQTRGDRGAGSRRDQRAGTRSSAAHLVSPQRRRSVSRSPPARPR